MTRDPCLCLHWTGFRCQSTAPVAMMACEANSLFLLGKRSGWSRNQCWIRAEPQGCWVRTKGHWQWLELPSGLSSSRLLLTPSLWAAAPFFSFSHCSCHISHSQLLHPPATAALASVTGQPDTAPSSPAVDGAALGMTLLPHLPSQQHLCLTQLQRTR